jgi:hypothetical protein
VVEHAGQKDPAQAAIFPPLAPPNFSSVCELNLEKSHLKGPTPRRIAVSIEHEADTMQQRVLVVKPADVATPDAIIDGRGLI